MIIMTKQRSVRSYLYLVSRSNLHGLLNAASSRGRNRTLGAIKKARRIKVQSLVLKGVLLHAHIKVFRGRYRTRLYREARSTSLVRLFHYRVSPVLGI